MALAPTTIVTSASSQMSTSALGHASGVSVDAVVSRLLQSLAAISGSGLLHTLEQGRASLPASVFARPGCHGRGVCSLCCHVGLRSRSGRPYRILFARHRGSRLAFQPLFVSLPHLSPPSLPLSHSGSVFVSFTGGYFGVISVNAIIGAWSVFFFSVGHASLVSVEQPQRCCLVFGGDGSVLSWMLQSLAGHHMPTAGSGEWVLVASGLPTIPKCLLGRIRN